MSSTATPGTIDYNALLAKVDSNIVETKESYKAELPPPRAGALNEFIALLLNDHTLLSLYFGSSEDKLTFNRRIFLATLSFLIVLVLSLETASGTTQWFGGWFLISLIWQTMNIFFRAVLRQNSIRDFHVWPHGCIGLTAVLTVWLLIRASTHVTVNLAGVFVGTWISNSLLVEPLVIAIRLYAANTSCFGGMVPEPTAGPGYASFH